MRAATGSSSGIEAPGRARAWWLAARPWSFTISLAPVLAGTSLAALGGRGVQAGIVAAALLACLLIHAGTNLQNDVGDFRRGADGAGRIGPPRATTKGWLSPAEVQLAALLCFALALAPGAYLAARGGWPIVALGVASIAAGAAYTAGPRPIAYSGWGEAFVIVFFGFVAVGGMYYLHTGALGAVALLAGAALGALAAAVLVVNNLRDIDTDRRIGKLTLAVRLGRRFSVWEYAALVHAPFGVAALLSLYEPLVLLPWASFLARRLWQEPRGAGLNGVLAATARLGLAFALLLSLAAQLRSSA